MNSESSKRSLIFLMRSYETIGDMVVYSFENCEVLLTFTLVWSLDSRPRRIAFSIVC